VNSEKKAMVVKVLAIFLASPFIILTFAWLLHAYAMALGVNLAMEESIGLTIIIWVLALIPVGIVLEYNEDD